jgi:hypothetical protein
MRGRGWRGGDTHQVVTHVGTELVESCRFDQSQGMLMVAGEALGAIVAVLVVFH